MKVFCIYRRPRPPPAALSPLPPVPWPLSPRAGGFFAFQGILLRKEVCAIPIPFWRCGKCRREHDSYEKAEHCEASHHTPVSVETKQFTHRPYPYALNVTFEDGAVKVYNAEEMGG